MLIYIWFYNEMMLQKIFLTSLKKFRVKAEPRWNEKFLWNKAFILIRHFKKVLGYNYYKKTKSAKCYNFRIDLIEDPIPLHIYNTSVVYLLKLSAIRKSYLNENLRTVWNQNGQLCKTIQIKTITIESFIYKWVKMVKCDVWN